MKIDQIDQTEFIRPLNDDYEGVGDNPDVSEEFSPHDLKQQTLDDSELEYERHERDQERALRTGTNTPDLEEATKLPSMIWRITTTLVTACWTKQLELRQMADVQYYTTGQLAEIRAGHHTPPLSARDLEERSAAQSTAAQPDSHRGEESPVSPSLATGVSVNQFVKERAAPSTKSTTAPQSHFEEAKSATSITRPAFSRTYQSLAGDQNTDSRLSGYRQDVDRRSAATSNAG